MSCVRSDTCNGCSVCNPEPTDERRDRMVWVVLLIEPYFPGEPRKPAGELNEVIGPFDSDTEANAWVELFQDEHPESGLLFSMQTVSDPRDALASANRSRGNAEDRSHDHA